MLTLFIKLPWNSPSDGIIYRVNCKLLRWRSTGICFVQIQLDRYTWLMLSIKKHTVEEDKLFQCFNRNDTRGVNSRYGNLSLKFARVYYKVCRCNKFARRILRLKAFIIRYRKWKCFPFFSGCHFFFLMAKHQRFKS